MARVKVRYVTRASRLFRDWRGRKAHDDQSGKVVFEDDLTTDDYGTRVAPTGNTRDFDERR